MLRLFRSTGYCN